MNMQKHEWRDNPVLCLEIKQIGNRTKWLEKNLGGKWKYSGGPFGFCRSWTCDDGRRVRYTAAPVDEFDNPCGSPQCWIDTPGQPTKAFYWDNHPIISASIPS
jgi:hypothetical protein